MVLVGIGQELRGDDGAGLEVARSLLRRQRRHPGKGPESGAPALHVVEGGPAPENCTGLIRRFAPDLVLLVDAADMEEAPGTIRWLDCEDTTGWSASTHGLPPYMFTRYLLAECRCAVALIGIQILQNSIGAPLSPAVERAVLDVVEGLAEALQVRS
ncbi:MAG TPA: hydrogenase 3 maturation endopeptidase HyCI [Candidatus Methylomirabilis sp.]|nr:hydrogenase 3 maturation endopeptidase HyCI [Candidatus Methylomirabilis sp.]